MSEWKKCRKLPVVVEYRIPIINGITGINSKIIPCEVIETLEGKLAALPGRDYVIRGVDGEIYPIKKDIFYRTYEVLDSD